MLGLWGHTLPVSAFPVAFPCVVSWSFLFTDESVLMVTRKAITKSMEAVPGSAEPLSRN